MLIRKAEEWDLASILNLYQELETGGMSLDYDKAKRIFNKMSRYPDYSVYVAESDDEVIGTFALAVMDNIAHMGAPSGLIEDVVVTGPHQREGIGKQMMSYALELCKQKGCYKVALSSNKKRLEAHLFYENLGFELHGYSFTVEFEQKPNAGIQNS